jgi:hypothetical protein
MKDAKFTLEFVSHCLANGRSQDRNCDTFDRDSEGRLIWSFVWFYAAFQKAIDGAGLYDLKPGYINPCLTVNAKVSIYKRKIKENWFRRHEAIDPGTRVTFAAVVDDVVTESSLRTLLDWVGKFVGISPYGYNLGFGRFNVIEVVVDSGVRQVVHDSSPAVGS